jgi:hypothetical protein
MKSKHLFISVFVRKVYNEEEESYKSTQGCITLGLVVAPGEWFIFEMLVQMLAGRVCPCSRIPFKFRFGIAEEISGVQMKIYS